MLPIEELAWRYISKMPPSIQGQGGSAAAFRVACVLVRGYSLPDDIALRLFQRWNESFAQPVWSDAELLHKLKDAREKGQMQFGHLLRDDDDTPRKQCYTPPAPRPVTPERDRAAERAKHQFSPIADDDEQGIVDLRHVTRGMTHLFKNKSLLHNTIQDGHRCWCLVEGTFAQARRYDGGMLQTARGPSKAKTLWGSEGYFFGKTFLRTDHPVLMVEGVVGLLEAASVIDLANAPWLPFAAVSAGSSFLKDPQTLDLFRGRRVRILPDMGEAGMSAAARWLAELESVGAHVDVVGIPEANNDLATILADLDRYAATLNTLFA